MGGPDMTNVVQIGRTNARGQTTLTPDELAKRLGMGFEGFSTIPNSPPVDTGEPDAKKDGGSDPTLDKVFDQMGLGDNADDDHKDHSETPDKNPAEEIDNMVTPTGIPDVSELRSLLEATERKKATRLAQLKAVQEKQEQMQAKAPETLAFLDEKIFPALEQAMSENDKESIEALNQIVDRARLNSEVAKILDDRKHQRQTEVEQAAAVEHQEQVQALYADLPDDPDAEPYRDGKPRKLNSPLAALEATQNKGDTALLVVHLPADTIVPTGKGEFAKLTCNGAVQLRVTVTKAEGNGDDRRIFRIAQVTKETEGLYFGQVKSHSDARPGTFGFIPPYFTMDTRRDPNARRNDPFDALKDALYRRFKPEHDARRQEEREGKATANATLSATHLLLEGAVGSAVVESRWVLKVGRGNDRREFPRYLRVVLQRDEEGGPVHVAAWGPYPANRFSPRLNSIQPRRDNEFVHLNVEARIEEGDEGPKAFVNFTTVDESMVEGDNEQVSRVKDALHDLRMCARQALVNEYAAAESNQDGKPHRHYFRKEDGTCRCGERKPAEVTVAS
jgi:hypothetical protein